MKAFIEANFKMIDIDNDGVIGAKEYRYNCITRIAVDNIQVVDEAFDKLLDVSINRFSFSCRSSFGRQIRIHNKIYKFSLCKKKKIG